MAFSLPRLQFVAVGNHIDEGDWIAFKGKTRVLVETNTLIPVLFIREDSRMLYRNVMLTFSILASDEQCEGVEYYRHDLMSDGWFRVRAQARDDEVTASSKHKPSRITFPMATKGKAVANADIYIRFSPECKYMITDARKVFFMKKKFASLMPQGKYQDYADMTWTQVTAYRLPDMDM